MAAATLRTAMEVVLRRSTYLEKDSVKLLEAVSGLVLWRVCHHGTGHLGLDGASGDCTMSGISWGSHFRKVTFVPAKLSNSAFEP